MVATDVRDLKDHIGETVLLQGWLYNKRSKGKIHFLQIRDGTGTVQAVAFVNDVDEATFATCGDLEQECSLELTGEVREDSRSPGGVEIGVKGVVKVGDAPEYPISKKEHGVEFLMDHRHLWFRSSKQHALLRIRAEVVAAAQEILNGWGFVRFDTPILTPCSAEGTTDLFSTPYFDLGDAYLAQTGQLYVEAGMMAHKRVYCYGPTFRAERSKTRRHLIEFWMIEPEVAFADHDANLRLQEEYVSGIVRRVLDRCPAELETLGRDVARLEAVTAPFPRITYDEAIEIIREHHGDVEGCEPIEWGEDFGAPHETLIANRFDKPVFVERFPLAIKAFYMAADPARPDLALCADLLAPEGYGEIIGGSQRVHDAATLESRIVEQGLNVDDYQWYLDLRRYGSVPHSGFGLGIERTIAWIAGVPHIRETIPFPRQIHRNRP
jgi:asparaginyl-tRNA synthetase